MIFLITIVVCKVIVEPYNFFLISSFFLDLSDKCILVILGLKRSISRFGYSIIYFIKKGNALNYPKKRKSTMRKIAKEFGKPREMYYKRTFRIFNLMLAIFFLLKRVFYFYKIFFFFKLKSINMYFIFKMNFFLSTIGLACFLLLFYNNKKYMKYNDIFYKHFFFKKCRRNVVFRRNFFFFLLLLFLLNIFFIYLIWLR